MRNKELYIAMPVYNEEKSLEKCLSSLNREVTNLGLRVQTYLCLNGCVDNSHTIADSSKKKFPKLNIIILSSSQGKLKAQEKIVQNIPTNKVYVAFVDSDIELKKDSLKNILLELKRHKELLCVGAFPEAKKYVGVNPWKKFLDEILNIRSRYPRAEISKFDVKEYHQLAFQDPQSKNTSPEHELKSKIFFHGRLFVLRSKDYWKKPDKESVVGDDSYLPDYIIYNFGKNRIRIRYDSIVYFNPFVSIFNHYRAYKRIYYDLKILKDAYPKFKNIRKHSQMVLNWPYINKKGSIIIAKFLIFSLIRSFEKLFFLFSLNKEPKTIWNYNLKN
ncbi:glycosyltransferase family 2 protein [Candidatus Woesearchaeota archaeon]|nr:glycosyltransferase family 2 protein [Candidatus Woesearchaeota archaeon]